jgi:hypothetical protein
MRKSIARPEKQPSELHQDDFAEADAPIVEKLMKMNNTEGTF